MLRADSEGTTPHLDQSDEALVRQAQKGSLDAFTALYHRYLSVVYNRVRYRIPSQDVEDVTQEVFISALKSLGSFRGAARFSTWLRTLADRRIADYYRRRREVDAPVVLDPADIDQIAVRQPDQADGISLDQQLALQRALAALPDHYRDILLMRFAEGLKFEEIAQVRGLSLEAAKSLFRRAVAALREELGE
jgi:RNA polymerase sigma-70 factor (ECF subfamily)